MAETQPFTRVDPTPSDAPWFATRRDEIVDAFLDEPEAFASLLDR